VFGTLRELGSWPGGAEVVFDYSNLRDHVTGAATRAHHGQLAERVAASGEPFRCHHDTSELHARAGDLGSLKSRISTERLSLRAIFRTWPPLRDPDPAGGHVVRMATR
jgi:hypothetical protein